LSRVAILGIVLALVSTLLAGSQTIPTRAADVEEFAFGVIVDTTDERGMQMARDGGFTHAKMMLQWANVEPSPGNYVWNGTRENDFDNIMKPARNQGLALIVRVDGVPGWAGGSPARANLEAVENFYRAAASYGAGTVVGYEILNEPNLDREWGGAPDPAAYTAFMKAAYRGIKDGDPNALVIGGGPAPGTGNNPGATIEDVDFIRGMYDAGAKGFMDALAAHSYGGNTEPERDPNDCGICFRRTERYRQIMVERGDADTPIWLTEWGYLMDPGHNMGQYDWMRVSAGDQAEFIVRAHRFALKSWPWLTGSLLFNIDGAASPYQNYGPVDAKAWFSILNADYSPRPAYSAFQEYRAKDLEKIAAKKATAAALEAKRQAALEAAQAGAQQAGQTSGAPSEAPVAADGPRGRVAGTDGDGVNLRTAPSLTAARLKTIPEGALVQLNGEPVQAEGLAWRSIRDQAGASGYVAAQYVKPL
jgi:hypothetical protein